MAAQNKPKAKSPKQPRPAPVRTPRAQMAPHVRTLANGQPRPKTRRSK